MPDRSQLKVNLSQIPVSWLRRANCAKVGPTGLPCRDIPKKLRRANSAKVGPTLFFIDRIGPSDVNLFKSCVFLLSNHDFVSWHHQGKLIRAMESTSAHSFSLLKCVLGCPLLEPIACGGNFWCSSTVVNTRQFFTKLCTKMSTFGTNLVWRQFLVFLNCGEHKAILY